MTEKDESNTLNEEWDFEAAVEMSFQEAEEQAREEAEEQTLKWARAVIEKFHQERGNKNDQ